MNTKHRLLCASALGGTLLIAGTPAWADCTVTASPEGDVVVCSNTTADGVVLNDGTASVLNQGTLTGASTSAIRGGTDTGSITNTGTITVSSGGPHHGVDIAGMKADATLTNKGLIQSGTGSSDAIRIGGSARIDNQSVIQVRSAGTAAIRVGDGSRVDNRAGATIRGMADPDNFGVLAGAASTVVNGGAIQNVGYGIDVGADSIVENTGTIEARYAAVDAGARAHVTNGLTGILRADQGPAVDIGVGGVFVNHGVVEAFDEASDDQVAVRIERGVLVNEATGVIGKTPGGEPVAAIAAHGSTIQNAGVINGAVWNAHALYNGVSTGGLLLGGPSRIDGEITMTNDGDLLQNAGVITGDISLRDGQDLLINFIGSVITGDIDLGSSEAEAAPPVGEDPPYRNVLTNSGTINGDIIGSENTDEVDLSGVHNGDISLGGGADLLKFSGTLNGTALMGAGDDQVIVYDRPILGAGGRIDAEGGDGDHLVFNGDGGTWYADQFGNFEKLTKLGGGRTVLKDTWWGYAEVNVTAGELVVDSGSDDGLAGELTVSNTGVYRLNGTHYGDIHVVDGGTLTGIGSTNAQGVEAVHVHNLSGVVAPGNDGIGTLTLSNDYHQGALGRLDIELGAPGQSDRLVIGGTAYLDGTVRFIPLSLADTGPYVFMEYNAVSGQFATIAGAAGLPGLFYSYTIDYQAGQAVVNVVKTGTATEEPDPEPVPGCTPSPAPSGSTVICLPALTGPQIFTAQDLDIRVNGVLTYASAAPVLRTTGSNIKLTVLADAGVVNDTADSSAVVMEGETNHLANHGLIRSGAADAASASRVVVIDSALGKTSTVLNGDTGVIGHAGTSAGTAIHATGGAIELENRGRIHGAIRAEGEQAAIINGRRNGEGVLTGPAVIVGDIFTTQGADQILNLGTITGDISTGAGSDRIENAVGATIEGDIDAGVGSDDIIIDGVVRGTVRAGADADSLEIYGTLDGDALMGDGDDQVRIANATAPGLTAGHTIDGGDGWDRLTFSGQTGAWDAAQFAGFEILRKEGGGVTTLTGVWDHLDPTNASEVASGELRLAQGAEMHSGMSVRNAGHYRIDGQHLAHVGVDDGGLVSGSGAIGSAALFAAEQFKSLMNGGVVAPGANGLGTLTVWGDYHQGGGGRLDIELGANGQSDVLDVKGQAILNGAVQFIPLDAGVTGAYTFLKAAGGVTGSFGSVNPDVDLAQQGLMFTYALNYATPGQVSVNVIKTGSGNGNDDGNGDGNGNGNPPPDVLDIIANLTANQTAVRDAFLSDGVFTSDLARVRADLNEISLDKAARALDSFSGELYASTPSIATRATRRFARAIDDRLGDQRLGLSPEGAAGLTVWADLIAASGHQKGGAGASGYDQDVVGAVVGADMQRGPGLRLGVAMGRTQADIDQPRLDASARIASNHVGAYASAELGTAFIDAQAGYAWHDLDARRTLMTGNETTRQARGETASEQLHASVRAGYTLTALEATWRPYGALDLTRIQQDAFVESGAGDAGLKVDGIERDAVTATLGLDASWAVGTLRPYAGAAIRHDLNGEGREVRVRMIGGGDLYRIQGAGADDTALLGRFGLAGALGAVDVKVGYDIEARDGFMGHALTAGVRLRW